MVDIPLNTLLNPHLLARIAMSVALLCVVPLVNAVDKQSAPWVGETLGGLPCSGGNQGYGPYDYTKRSTLRKNISLVEGAHFTYHVESLTAGNKGESDNPLPDLDYTLRAFPNHHRALNSAIRYHFQKMKTFRHDRFSATECYLQRAINFSPNDATSHMLYAIFLHKQGLLDDARNMYNKAEQLAPTDVEIKYNYGLLLVKLNDMQAAREKADFVYSRGFPLMGLKNMVVGN